MSCIYFEKVSFETFSSAMKEKGYTSDTQIAETYEGIKLPTRATTGSAGYDFYSPIDFTLAPDGDITICTGIRAIMPQQVFLAIYPRSGLGFKYQVGLVNTVGIIDSDYSGSDNEGHIMIKLVNHGHSPLSIEAGKGISQGIFQPHYIVDNDCVIRKRNGGGGSTDKDSNK